MPYCLLPMLLHLLADTVDTGDDPIAAAAGELVSSNGADSSSAM
jgi:hypothetical protein